MICSPSWCRAYFPEYYLFRLQYGMSSLEGPRGRRKLMFNQASIKGFSKFKSRFYQIMFPLFFLCDRYLNIHLIPFSLKEKTTVVSLPCERITEVLLNFIRTILLSCSGKRAGGKNIRGSFYCEKQQSIIKVGASDTCPVEDLVQNISQHVLESGHLLFHIH